MLSNREMQSLGAVYLSNYCKFFDIADTALNELVSHLLKILGAADLPAWDNDGRNLAVCGRGEPIPEHIEDKVPKGRLSEFNVLLEHVVEIGIVDLYGADTGQPRRNFEQAKLILEANDVPIPKSSLFQIQSRPLRDTWGEPLSVAEYKSFVGGMLKEPN